MISGWFDGHEGEPATAENNADSSSSKGRKPSSTAATSTTNKVNPGLHLDQLSIVEALDEVPENLDELRSLLDSRRQSPGPDERQYSRFQKMQRMSSDRHDRGGSSASMFTKENGIISHVVSQQHLDEYDTVSYVMRTLWKIPHSDSKPLCLGGGDNEQGSLTPPSTPLITLPILVRAPNPGFTLGFHRKHFPVRAVGYLDEFARPVMNIDDLVFPIFCAESMTDEDDNITGKSSAEGGFGSPVRTIAVRSRNNGAVMVRNLLRLYAELDRQDDFYGRAVVFTVDVSELTFRLVCHWASRRSTGGDRGSNIGDIGEEDMDDDDDDSDGYGDDHNDLIYYSKVLRCWAVGGLDSYAIYSDLVRTVRNVLDWSLEETLSSILEGVAEVECLLHFHDPPSA